MSDATWAGPGNDWNANTNWSPQTVPDGTATFAGASPTTVTFSALTTIETVQFADIFVPNPPFGVPYTFNLSGQIVAITGTGIVNNAGHFVAPTFNALGLLEFDNAATAGDAIINNTPGATSFTDQSTAGFATITSSGGGLLSFTDNSTAGQASITTNSGGLGQFTTNSTGGVAAFITNGSGIVDFSGTAGPDGLNQVTAGSIAGSGTYKLGANQLTVGANDLSTTVSGVVADGGTLGGTGASLVKVGFGTLLLDGANTYSGGTSVSVGTLGGTGTIGAVTVNGGTLAPGDAVGTGTFHTGSATLMSGAIFAIDLNGTGAGQFDQLQVTGTVSIGGATLAGNLGFTPANGDTFLIIDSDGTADSVSGTFGNAPGNVVGFDGRAFSVNYAGGDGNDVVLTALANGPPSLTGFGPSVTFLENDVNAAPEVLDNDVAFSDVEGNFNGGTLTVTGLLAEDTVSIGNQGSDPGQVGFDNDPLSPGFGTVSFEGIPIGTASGGAGTTLTVSFNANATTAAIDALIQDLTYANSSDSPTASRTLTVAVTDAAAASTGGIPITVNVTAQNELPVLTNVDSNAAYTEGTAPTALDTAPLIVPSDVDGGTLSSATIAITSGFVAGDILDFPDFPIPASLGASYDPTTGVLTINAVDTLADYQQVLRGITFSSTSDNPTNFGFNQTRTITWTVTDNGSSPATSVPVTTMIAVTAVNDPPVNTVPGPQSVTVDTDHAIAGLAVSDPDLGPNNITVTLHVDHGTLHVRDDLGAGFLGASDISGNDTATVTLTSNQAFVDATLAASIGVVYRSNLHFIGADTLTITSYDGGSTGAGGALQDIDTVAIAVHPANFALQVTGDFDGDGKDDILSWQTDGTLLVSEMDGTSFKVQGSPGLVDPIWHVAGVADFDGDGKDDILFRQDDGTLQVTEMNGTAFKASGSPGQVYTGWHFTAAADFDGDGKGDILWTNDARELFVTEMNGLVYKAGASPGSYGSGWTFADTADFDGDGKSDILWRSKEDGSLFVTEMNGLAFKAGASPGTVDLAWHIESTRDYDGDGKADILWRNDAGTFFVTEMDGTSFKAGASPGTVGTNFHVAGGGDYDGDGKADLLLRQGDGTLFVTEMNGTAFKAGGSPGLLDPIQHVVGDQHDLFWA
jgi:autotransporter-associated beta strand protein